MVATLRFTAQAQQHTAELQEMLAEYRSALAAGVASGDPEDDPEINERYTRAFQALVDARPSDAAGAANAPQLVARRSL
jgi:hypothetical protein